MILTVRLAVLAIGLVLTQTGINAQVITEKMLPLFPIKQEQVAVVNGSEFELIPRPKDETIDFRTEMPALAFSNGKTTLGTVVIPAGYIVTNDPTLSIEAVGAKGRVYHWLEIVRYRQAYSQGYRDQVIVSLYDGQIFSIGFTDPTDFRGFSCHASLATLINGKTELDISQTIRGSGGYHNHAFYEFLAEGPKLVKLSHGGRDY